MLDDTSSDRFLRDFLDVVGKRRPTNLNSHRSVLVVCSSQEQCANCMCGNETTRLLVPLQDDGNGV
jgi:hypothetical protein